MAVFYVIVKYVAFVINSVSEVGGAKRTIRSERCEFLVVGALLRLKKECKNFVCNISDQ